METIRVDEVGLSKAIQRYLEDNGYTVHHLQLVHDNKSNEFYALVKVEKD